MELNSQTNQTHLEKCSQWPEMVRTHCSASDKGRLAVTNIADFGVGTLQIACVKSLKLSTSQAIIGPFQSTGS